jgi:zinc transport system substrate-binding protein
MRQALMAAGPACVFSEPPLRPRLAETLSAGLPVRLAELDALGSNVPVAAQGYMQLLQGLANGMLDCLNSVEQGAGG